MIALFGGSIPQQDGEDGRQYHRRRPTKGLLDRESLRNGEPKAGASIVLSNQIRVTITTSRYEHDREVLDDL